MIFVFVFLLILAIIFLSIGLRKGDDGMRDIGIVFLIAALGAGVVSYIALSII